MPKRVSPYIAMKRLVEAGAAYPYPLEYHENEEKYRKTVNQIQKDLVDRIVRYMREHGGQIPTSRHLHSISWKCGLLSSRRYDYYHNNTDRDKMIKRALRKAREVYNEL